MDKLSDLGRLPIQHRFFDASFRRLNAGADEHGAEDRTRWPEIEDVFERAIEEDQKLYEVAISSEFAVPRWFGTETLLHKRSAIDMTYLKRGAAVLVDHGFTGDGDQVGVVEAARLDDDKVLRGVVRFSRNERGQEIERDVVDRIRRFISVGYQWLEARMVGQSDSDGEAWEVTRWQPMEVSFVSVPADISVGVGRSAETRAIQFTNATRQQETTTMDPQTTPTQGNGSAPVVSGGRDLATEFADIAEMCSREGRPELAAKYVREGRTPDQVGRLLLSERGSVQPSELRPPIELKPQEGRRYSIIAALRGALAIVEGRGAEFTGLEREVHDELVRTMPAEYKRHGGVMVPMFTQTRATPPIDSVTATAAKELVFTSQGEFIDLLRNQMVTTRLGATFLPGLVGPVGFPRQTGAAQAFWVAENPAADVTESNLTTDLVTLSPKTIQATTSYTRQLLAQTSINVEALVRDDLTKVHGLKWDQTALHGAGSATEPAGIYNIAGVNSHAVGGVPNFADVIDMEAMLATDNALFGTLGWVMTPGLAGKLMQTLVASAAGSEMIWVGNFEDGRVGGYKAVASNQVSAVLGAGAEHGIIFGNWADLLIGTWGGFEVIVDPYAQKKRGIIEVTTFQMADMDVRHPESFVKGTGATIV